MHGNVRTCAWHAQGRWIRFTVFLFFFVVITGSLTLRLLSLDVSVPNLCAVLVGTTVTPIRLLVVAVVWKNKPLPVCLSVCLSVCQYIYFQTLNYYTSTPNH